MPQKVIKWFSAMSGCHKQAWYNFSLQRISVSKQIGENTSFQKNPFQRITIITKGQTRKIKGAICNIPVQKIVMNCIILSRSPKGNGIFIVKLNRKIQCICHVSFEVVRPEMVAKLLTYLQNINPSQKNIVVDLNNMLSQLKTFIIKMNKTNFD